jgi:hypothetical protein
MSQSISAQGRLAICKAAYKDTTAYYHAACMQHVLRLTVALQPEQ